MQKKTIIARNSPFFYLTDLVFNRDESYIISDIGKFPDGETWVRLATGSVLGAKECSVIIIHHLYPNPNERLMELLLMIDAAVRDWAAHVSVFIPYFCYSRQDRVTSNCHANSACLVFDLLKEAGADRIITIDLHNRKSRLSDLLISLYPQDTIAQCFLEEVDSNDKLTLVAADAGSCLRICDVAKDLKRDCAITAIEKRRDNNGNVCHMELTDDVSGRVCLIVDDIIAGGQTICKAADLLREGGAKKVLAYATHPLLLGDAVEKINKSCIEMLYVGDTIGTREITNSKKIKVVQLLNKLTINDIHEFTLRA